MSNSDMKETPSIDPSQQTSPMLGVCRVCSEPIKSGAQKCNKCGSYQDWTRHLLRWSALLISIFGLAPLWSISMSLHDLASTPDKAVIEAAITKSTANEVSIAFTNSGKRDGIVTDVNFFILHAGSRVKRDVELRPTEAFVVSPNKPPAVVGYKAYSGNTETNFFSNSNADPACLFIFDITWIDFKGTKKTITRQCSCPQ